MWGGGGVSLAGSTRRVKSVKLSSKVYNSERLVRLSPNLLCVFKGQVAVHITRVMGVAHLHVHTCRCTPLFTELEEPWCRNLACCGTY